MAEKEISLKELKDLADDNEIDLSARGLTTVPKALPQVFHSFPSLELGSNMIHHLPDNIGALVHLEHLDLYNNEIEELPLSFANLQALRWLDLKKNPLQPELLKAAGNCGSEKECKQAAVSVLSYMKELAKVHHIQMLKQQKINEKIHEVKGEPKEGTHKNKKKHNNKKDDNHALPKQSGEFGEVIAALPFEIDPRRRPSNANAKTKFSQAKEQRKEKEAPKPVTTNRGFFSRMIRFLLKLSLMTVAIGGLAATIGILLNCADGGKRIPGSKPLCADLTKLSEFKGPSDKFLLNARKTYGTVFSGYWSQVQPTVVAAQKKWQEFHREFVKSDIGVVVDRYYHKAHAFVVDTTLRFVRFLDTQRVAVEKWWEKDGRQRLGGVVDTIKVTCGVVTEIAKDMFKLTVEALQSFYHRVEVFVTIWSNHGLSKAIEAGF
ncbi:unnamed protein product [Heligmosomoides polygyrus]|uniref:Leucine-rich repeat protein n=1 Tax=Heligmosomoides polygyrus TaxID=6339 RepID=A0A3P8BAD4_HELPZ|nr:unnamed protein product [Heligmosomoides polygyrus]